MLYLGDFSADATSLSFNFNTRKLTGEPVNPSISAIDVYKDGEESPLSLEFDSLLWGQEETGRTSVYLMLAGTNDDVIIPGHDYTIVITTGTVDSISVAGTVLAQFSVENRTTLSSTESANILSLTLGSISTAVNDALTTSHGVGSWAGTIVGDDSVEWTYTVYQEDGVTPLPDCRVWVTTDTAGQNVVAGPYVSDYFGVVTFILNTGPHYIWRRKTGWQFDNPDFEVVEDV